MAVVCSLYRVLPLCWVESPLGALLQMFYQLNPHLVGGLALWDWVHTLQPLPGAQLWPLRSSSWSICFRKPAVDILPLGPLVLGRQDWPCFVKGRQGL